jgi:two-component system, chemotaxis family, chemotaxis protein CheY
MSGYRFDRLRVLMVDDNPHMRRIVATIMNAFGVTQILEAENAEAGWKVLREANPDVVITDWMMGEMNGVDFVKMVRTSAGTANPFVPIIMLSGYTSAELVRDARDAGVNEFLAKPVSVKSMLTRLTAVIEHPRAFVRTKGYFGPCRRRRNLEEYKGPERRDVAEAAVA